MTINAAHAFFTITGEALTDIARDLMLSDEPGKAYRLLADCLIGEGADEVARKVLAGEVNLVGDSVKGIGVETAEPDDVREYVTLMRYVYAGRVKLQGRWYRPRGVILGYGTEDARAALAGTTVDRIEDVGIGVASAEFGRRRAEFYANPGERVEHVQYDGHERYAVFEPCAESPQWLKPAVDAQAALDEVQATDPPVAVLGVHGSTRPTVEVSRMLYDGELEPAEADELRELAEEAEDEQHAALLVQIAAKVREQAGDDVFALTLQDGRVVQVPRAPFVHWALARMPEVDRDRLSAWSPVAPSGLKLCNDDPYHTDWLLGAGLTLAEGYEQNVSGPAWRAAADIQIAEVDRG